MKPELKDSITLDELWSEALSLGRLEIDSDYDGTIYTVSIVPKLSSRRRLVKVGSVMPFLIAKGSDSCIKFAMAQAIREARKMKS